LNNEEDSDRSGEVRATVVSKEGDKGHGAEIRSPAAYVIRLFVKP
jgi:hypothetical protein